MSVAEQDDDVISGGEIESEERERQRERESGKGRRLVDMIPALAE